MPHVSFIIPAYNEELYVPRAIDSIHEAARAAGVEYEIIVVDDGSDDRTGEVARAHGAIVHRVELRHIAAVRNAGAKQARGEVLVFLDADTVLPSDTFAAALRSLENRAIVGGGCRVRLDGRVPLYASFMVWIITLGFRLIRWAAGCFIFCRREAFEAVGGFDEEYYASEEIWISRALKGQGKFIMLREHVISSGRKARQYPIREMIPILIRLLVKGPNGTKTREGLEFWYDSRREEELPD